MRRSPAVLLALLVAPVLAGCGNDEPPARSAGEGTPSRSAPAPSSTPAPAPSPSAAPGPIARPAPSSCTPVQESPDGVYPITGVGTVTLTRQGSGIALAEVRGEEGWSVDASADEDEADVEFRRGDEDVDFEADLEDDGRLELEVCDDDD